MDGTLRYSRVKILFFAKARELTDLNETLVVLPASISYPSLLDTIVRQFGLDSIRDTVILSVNEQYVASDVPLTLADGDEIAVIPPLSGGNFFTSMLFSSEMKFSSPYCRVKMDASKDVVKLQTEQLSVGEIVNLVVAPNCGAISTFVGTTRDNFDDKKV